MGDKKEFLCMDGMKYEGESNQTFCMENGSWSNPLPKCLAPCVIPSIEHASAIYTIPPDILIRNQSEATLVEVEPGNVASHGSYLEVVCNKNYDLDEQMDENNIIQAPVCNNSTWSYEPMCRHASCKSAPPNPKNGRVRVVSMDHGSRGFIHCLDGYRLNGDRVTLCNKGQWQQVESTCVEIYCGFPGTIEHGRVLLVGLTGMYDYKPYIRRISNNRQIAYECENGYHLNDGAPSGATCIDGHWRPEGLPTCLKE